MNRSWLPTLFIGLLLCIVFGEAKYTILIDAGSQGNRIYIYKYSESSVIETITDVAHKRARPALSSFMGDYEGLRQQMNFLVNFAQQIIPQEYWQESTISLKATAGMRAVPVNYRIALMRNVSSILSTSGFRFVSDDTKVLTGSEEALYGYLAIYIAFVSSFGRNHSMWAADLGGVSQQIAFAIPSLEEQLEKVNRLNDDNEKEAILSGTGTYFDSDSESVGNDMGLSTNAVEELMIDRLTKECGADYQFSLPTQSYRYDHDSSESSSLLSSTAPVSDAADTGDAHTSTNTNDDSTPHRASASIFTKSMHGLGLIAAMNQVIEFFKEQQQQQQQGIRSEEEAAPNPCLHPDTLFPFETNSSNDGTIYEKEYMNGSGHFDECVALIQTVFEADEDVRHVSKCVEEAKLRHVHQQHLLYHHLGLSDGDAASRLFGPASHSQRVVVAMDNFPKVLEVMRKRGVLQWGRADADDDLAFIASAHHMDDMLQDHCGVAGGAGPGADTETDTATAESEETAQKSGTPEVTAAATSCAGGVGSWDIVLWVKSWWRGAINKSNNEKSSGIAAVGVSGGEVVAGGNCPVYPPTTGLLPEEGRGRGEGEGKALHKGKEDNQDQQQQEQYQLASLFVSPRQIREAGKLICQEPWDELLVNLGAEFESTPYRAQRACFGASFVYSILTSVLGIEEDDNSSFLPVEMHVGYTLGWPLGAALYAALGLGGANTAAGVAAVAGAA